MHDAAQIERDKLAKVADARAIAAKAESEGRDFNDEERAQVALFIGEAKALNDQLLAINGDVAMLNQLNDLGRPVGELAKGLHVHGAKGTTLGTRFTKSAEFQEWFKEMAPTGQLSEKSRVGQSPAMAFEMAELGRKALITGLSDTSAGALVVNDNLGLRDEGTFKRPLVVKDLITTGQTGSDTIEYVRVTGFTNNAAPVAEATSELPIGDGTGGTTTPVLGGLKPKSSMTLAKVTAVVKTLAHWIPATKRALSDASQIRTLIDNFLLYGLDEETEDQMMNGDGTGENFDGLLHVSGTQAQAWDTDLFTTTRKAKRKVRTVGRATPSAFLFNPEDNERIDLAQDANDRFYGNGPFNLGPDILWGLPRIESEAVPVGVGLVGDFKQAVLWDREQSAIQVSDSHEDYFVRNLVAILAEMRAAFGIFRPSAFVKIDLTV